MLAGVGATTLAGALGLNALSARAASSKVVSWTINGPGGDITQKAVLPLFKKKFPDIGVDITSEPVGDFLAKVAVAMSAKSDRYDVICEDYNYVTQFSRAGSATSLEPYLEKDPAFRDDILSDIPENVLDLYRDKPAKEGGRLYGLPYLANCQLQYVRRDILDKYNLGIPETWDDVVTGEGRKIVGTTMRRGLFAGAYFIALLRSYGGDWFDKMEKGGFHPQLDGEEGHKAMDIFMKLLRFTEPVAFNASDDEANQSLMTGSWYLAPNEWGSAAVLDPQFSQFAHKLMVTKCPAGTGTNARSAGHMGGLGFFIPSYSHNPDAAWDFIKFYLSGPKQNPEVAKVAIGTSQQPPRLSLLNQYRGERPFLGGLADALPHAIRYPAIPESPSLYEIVGNEISEIAAGQKDPETALKAMQDGATRAMEKAGYYK